MSLNCRRIQIPKPWGFRIVGFLKNCLSVCIWYEYKNIRTSTNSNVREIKSVKCVHPLCLRLLPFFIIEDSFSTSFTAGLSFPIHCLFPVRSLSTLPWNSLWPVCPEKFGGVISQRLKGPYLQCNGFYPSTKAKQRANLHLSESPLKECMPWPCARKIWTRS